MIITIDGPSASGKSSAARELAKHLGFCHLNSGLLYRGLAYLLITKRRFPSDALAHVDAGDADTYLDPARFKYHCTVGGNGGITFDGQDITPFLKEEAISQGASRVSTNGYVRERLLEIQRAIGEYSDCVVDGRDTGSMVFPHAEIKFYLTASLDARAMRWQQDEQKHGHILSIIEAREQLAERDASDQKRVYAPLVIPQGAVVIDNSDFTPEQTVSKMLAVIQEKIPTIK